MVESPLEAGVAAEPRDSLDPEAAVGPRDSVLVFGESGGSTFTINLGSGGKNVYQAL